MQTSPPNFTLQPGGTATITYEAYCTDFGQKFPTTLQTPNAVADDKVRGGLAYIQQNNMSADATKALDAQYGGSGSCAAPPAARLAATQPKPSSAPQTPRQRIRRAHRCWMP